VAGLKTGELGSGILSRVLLKDLGQFLGLVITLYVLEAESHLNTTKQGGDIVALLGELSCRTDEALLTTELAKGSTTDTDRDVFEVRVGNAGDNGVDILLLIRLRDAVLVDDEVSSLLESLRDFLLDLRVSHGLVDGLETFVVAEVSSGGVGSVDSEELALDERLKIVDPVDAVDLGVTRLESSLLDTPLVE
jgi:hypothetical protein